MLWSSRCTTQRTSNREFTASEQTLRGTGAALATSEFICNLVRVACAVDRVVAFPADHNPRNCCCDDVIITHHVHISLSLVFKTPESTASFDSLVYAPDSNTLNFLLSLVVFVNIGIDIHSAARSVPLLTHTSLISCGPIRGGLLLPLIERTTATLAVHAALFSLCVSLQPSTH
ncbi:hypothetical protein GQ54DRAFT_125347 [Martensiomyces pterosporus]|nr:hypothetical protein GQ54DRAFT_125347 [Martensiomyces pterosporus]